MAGKTGKSLRWTPSVHRGLPDGPRKVTACQPADGNKSKPANGEVGETRVKAGLLDGLAAHHHSAHSGRREAATRNHTPQQGYGFGSRLRCPE